MDPLSLAWKLFTIAAAALFWSHCARPTLRAQYASPLAHRVVLDTTILLMTTYTLELVSELAALELSVWIYGLFMLIWVTWILVVGLGYLQGYRFLIRATGERHPRSN